MYARQHDRRGFALGMAIFAIALIGILAAGAFYPSLQQYRMGRNSLTEARALAAAELGQDTVYSQWDKSWNSFRAGTTFVRTFTLKGAVDTTRVTKLNNLTYAIVSEGVAGQASAQGEARRRTELLVRLNVPQIKTLGAITTGGTVKIGGSTTINGRDTTYLGWDCPPAGPAVAGAVVSAYSQIQAGGTCTGYKCIQGSPLVSADPAAKDTNTYFNYGADQNWNTMKAAAEKIVTGTLTGLQPSYNLDQSCKVSDPKNWGEPTKTGVLKSCENYYPVIYAPGDLSINGIRGQGILLVEKNLRIQGGFQFYGQVIVRGSVTLTGTGNHISGSVLAASVVDSTVNTLTGNSAIQYSRCVLNTVRRAGANPVRMRERSWAELF